MVLCTFFAQLSRIGLRSIPRALDLVRPSYALATTDRLLITLDLVQHLVTI